MATGPVITAQPVGYYVHHHGTGHMRRALTICRYIDRPVIMFSSAPEPSDIPPHITFVRLSSDVVAHYVQPADGVFHYTPYDPAIFRRNQQLIDAWQEFGIKEIYVDVSVEIAVLAKLYGLTVGCAVMPGVRTDRAHSLGYDTADYLLAHCAPEFDVPINRNTATPVRYSGGIARYAKRQPTSLKNSMPLTVVVTVSPKAERDTNDAILACAQRFPGTAWHTVGQKLTTDLKNVISHGIVDDPYEIYDQADVIIGSGGTNTIMEAAALGKPFICIPEPRPYDEQLAAARSLERLSAAVYLPEFPRPADWPAVCARLSQVDLTAFSALVSDDAATRAARIIETAGKTS